MTTRLRFSDCASANRAAAKGVSESRALAVADFWRKSLRLQLDFLLIGTSLALSQTVCVDGRAVKYSIFPAYNAASYVLSIDLDRLSFAELRSAWKKFRLE